MHFNGEWANSNGLVILAEGLEVFTLRVCCCLRKSVLYYPFYIVLLAGHILTSRGKAGQMCTRTVCLHSQFLIQPCCKHSRSSSQEFMSFMELKYSLPSGRVAFYFTIYVHSRLVIKTLSFGSRLCFCLQVLKQTYQVDLLHQACSDFYVMRATAVEFGLHGGNILINIHSEEWISTRIIICTIVPVFLYISCAIKYETVVQFCKQMKFTKRQVCQFSKQFLQNDLVFFSCGAGTQRGSWPPHSWGF